MARKYTPMLADPIDAVPAFGDWQMEPKYDGHRAMIQVTDDGAHITNRRGEAIFQVPHIEQVAMLRLDPGTVIDGEIVAKSGGWGQVQSVLGSRKVDSERTLVFMAFDVLVVAGQDVRAQPLRDRRLLLDALFKGASRSAAIRKVPRRKPSEKYLDELLTKGYEGAVVKRLDSRYLGGRRGRGWHKIKPQQTAEVECIGFYDADRGSKYDGIAVGGMRFRTAWGYEGRCAGMTDGLRIAMFQRPGEYVGLVAEVAHHGVAPDTGALRHPQFKRWRTDKDALTTKREASKGSRKRSASKATRVARTTVPTRRQRNYRAMTVVNLRRAVHELDPEVQGEAWHRSVNDGSGDPALDLRIARQALADKEQA